ncbi:YdbH domain-containing protein [Pseudomonas lopnurensis]|uniref:YdbH domain-containing protein n=1 Tax=Pseudomonas lopnurensis TaxID=1477517 RepID=UPI0028B133B5|nr:YdbH domain-containing protein [Pseudomonas lopnurensis]
MTKRPSIVLRLLLVLLALVMAAGGYTWYRWETFKREQGIVLLDWQGLRLSTRGLSLQRLNYAQEDGEGARLALQVSGLTLQLNSLLQPLPARSLQIDRFSLTWHSPSQQLEDASAPPPDWQQYQRWAAWLPQRLEIAALQLSLPCPRGRCDERGALRLQHAGEALLPLNVRLDLQRDEHRLSLLAGAERDGPATLLELDVMIDEQQRLESRSQLLRSGETQQWNGTLAMGSLPEAPWLLDWLGAWLSYAPSPLPDMPEEMRLGAGWALTLPERLDAALDWRDITGDLRLSASLPGFWPLVGIGQLQGQLDLAARGQDGLWLPTELQADLQLRPEPALLADLPPQLRPEQLNLKIEPGDGDAGNGRLPLQLHLSSQGVGTSELQARLQLAAAPPYALDIEQARLRVRSARLQLDALTLRDLDAILNVSGQANLDRAQLQLQPGSHIVAASLTSADFSASQLRAELAQLRLQAEPSQRQPAVWAVQGPAELHIGRLQHPQLLPQGWRWSGQLQAEPTRLSGAGPLRNDAGLALATNLVKPWDGPLQVSGRLEEIFLRAGNPLARTFTAWPALLELDSGRLQGSGQLSLPSGNGAPSANLALEARGLAGIFDRSELSGLDARLAASLQRNRLQIDMTELRLAQLNPGFAFGPLVLRGQYRADLGRPAQGQLSWQTAETGILGGRLWLDAASLDLAAAQQRLDVRLQGVQLPQLLTAYPAEGLSGSGILDGQFELRRSAQGLSVDQGNLGARAPGGVLRFRSPKIEALGQANPAMKIVAEALHDFHYDLLTSDVRYDENGKLNLGLRLNGRNPALEGGRPINFSINLEEDIPALLTSLQLSDRVSETIQRRVQERLQ